MRSALMKNRQREKPKTRLINVGNPSRSLYAEITSDIRKTIDNILKRGKISNREEYEVVINRVDEIFADPTNAEELKSLNELLTIYDME